MLCRSKPASTRRSNPMNLLLVAAMSRRRSIRAKTPRCMAVHSTDSPGIKIDWRHSVIGIRMETPPLIPSPYDGDSLGDSPTRR